MQSILSKARASSIIAAVVFLLFAYFMASGIAQLSANFSLGMLARAVVPLAVIAGVLLLVVTSKGMSVASQAPSLRQIVAVAVLALPATAFVLATSTFDPTLLLIIGGVTTAFILSLYLCLTSRGTYALVIFLLVFPLLSYLEYYFVPISELKIGPFAITPSILYIVFLCLLIPLTLKRGEGSRTSGSLTIPVASGAFVLVSFLSSLVSAAPWDSLGEVWLEVLVPFLVLPLILRFARGQKDIFTLAKAILAMVVGLTFIGLYFVGRNWGTGSFKSVYDIYGSGLSSNLSATYLAYVILMALPLGVGMLSGKVRLLAKGFIAVAIAFLFVGLIVTFVRAAFVAVGLSSAILMFKRSLRTPLLVGAALLAAIVILFSTALAGVLAFRYQTLITPQNLTQETSLVYRTYAWGAALAIIRDYPIWGIGFGQWKEYLPRYGQFQPVHSRFPGAGEIGYADHPHNYFLTIGVSAGLLGLSAWVCLLALVLGEGVYVVRKSKDPATSDLAFGALTGLIAMAFTLLFEGKMPLASGIVFWAITGLISVLGALTRKEAANLEAR